MKLTLPTHLLDSSLSAECQYKWTQLGLISYAVLSLGSMATMSVGAALFMIGFIFDGLQMQSSARVLGQEWRLIRTNAFSRRLLLSAAALSLVILASLLGALWHPLIFAGQAPAVHLPSDLGKIWYLFFPLALALGWRRLPSPARFQVLKSWLWTFSALTWVGLQQVFTGWPRKQMNPEFIPYNHPILFIGHHLSMASIWIFPFFAVLDWTMRSREASSDLRLFPVGVLRILVVLNVLILMLEFSRTLWIALPIGLATYFLWRLKGVARIAMVTLAGVSVAAASQLHVVQERLHSQMGVLERLALWKLNIEFVGLRPWLGVGFGKTGEVVSHAIRERFPEDYASHFVGHAHNLALEVLSGSGILGALALLFWFFAALQPAWSVRKLSKENPTSIGPLAFPAGLLCAWLVFFVNSLTQVNFWEGKVMHQVAWVTGLSLSWVLTPSSSEKVSAS